MIGCLNYEYLDGQMLIWSKRKALLATVEPAQLESLTLAKAKQAALQELLRHAKDHNVWALDVGLCSEELPFLQLEADQMAYLRQRCAQFGTLPTIRPAVLAAATGVKRQTVHVRLHQRGSYDWCMVDGGPRIFLDCLPEHQQEKIRQYLKETLA